MRWTASAIKKCLEIHKGSCNLQLSNNKIFENKGSFPSDLDSSTCSLEKESSIAIDEFQNVNVLFDNESMFDNDSMFSNEYVCPINGESDKNGKLSNSEDVTESIDNKMRIKVLPLKIRIVL